MQSVEFHRYRHTDYLGRRRITRHHLTPEDARQQLGGDAQIVPGSTVVRWLPETPAEAAGLCTGTGFRGPGSHAAEIQALASAHSQRVEAALAERAGGVGGVSVLSQDSNALDAAAEQLGRHSGIGAG